MATSKAQSEAVEILRSALHELESPKGSISGAVQKLARAAEIGNDADTRAWCGVQLADPIYTVAANELLKWAQKQIEDAKDVKPGDQLNVTPDKEVTERLLSNLEKVGLNLKSLTNEEINLKLSESAGGGQSVGFIEER